MLYLGIISKDNTRSIYELEKSEEIAKVHQKEVDGKVILRIEAPKEFLSDNHVEEYLKMIALLVSKIGAEPNTKGKPIVFTKIDDEDFCRAMEKFYQN